MATLRLKKRPEEKIDQTRDIIYRHTDWSGQSFWPESCRSKQDRVMVHGYDIECGFV